MSDNDLIRRGDALAELVRHAKGTTTIGGQNFRTILLGEAATAISAIPATPVPDVAALVDALSRIENGTCGEADPDTGELVECWMGEEEMQEVARAALSAWGAQSAEASPTMDQLQDAFFAGFAEGSDGGWVEGDPTPAWNKYLEDK